MVEKRVSIEAMEEKRFSTSSLCNGMLELWGVIGVAAILGNGARRVLPVAMEPLRSGEKLSRSFWSVYVGFSMFMAYAEGYQGFHRKFSPNVVDRALTLRTQGVLPRIFAPLYCMELFGAPAHRVGRAWSLVSAITLVVAAVKRMPPKARAIVDAGVVTGLSVGVMSLLYHYSNAALLGISPPSDGNPSSASDDTDEKKVPLLLRLCPVTFISNVVHRVLGGSASAVLGKPMTQPQEEQEVTSDAAPVPSEAPPAFMRGKSLVAYAEMSKPKPSLMWTLLCPLHWQFRTLRSVVAIGFLLLLGCPAMRRVVILNQNLRLKLTTTS